MSPGIRVAIADDEPLVRAGVRAILQSTQDIEVIGEADNGHDASEFVRRHRTDVLLLDIEMPRMDGITTTEEIRRNGLDTRVLILTTFGTDENLRRGLTAGADGFLLKASAPAELIAAVEAVATGGTVIAPRIARYLVSALRATPTRSRPPQLELLSDREIDVLRLLSSGRSNAGIAATLHLTEGTVKGYISTILRTLEVDHRVQAALIGYGAGLADPANPRSDPVRPIATL